jgi:hypothetical protein
MAEGADVPLSRTVPDISSRCPPAACVAAVLGDAQRRVSVLGGREGMPRSLGSVCGGAVTLFLRDPSRGLQGQPSRVIALPGVKSYPGHGMAVCRDHSTLLHAGIYSLYRTADGDGITTPPRRIGSWGDGRLQFKEPWQVCIAPDDFVFVADFGNHRVQVLTPRLGFHRFIGVGELKWPTGVCANDDIVVVSEDGRTRRCLSVFRRCDGTLLRRIGPQLGSQYGGSSADGFGRPISLCFMSSGWRLAVVDYEKNRVSVVGVDGVLVRHVGAAVLHHPSSVACTDYDELVVVDAGNLRLALFNAMGEKLLSFGSGVFNAVTIRDGSIFARTCEQNNPGSECVVFNP